MECSGVRQVGLVRGAGLAKPTWPESLSLKMSCRRTHVCLPYRRTHRVPPSAVPAEATDDISQVTQFLDPPVKFEIDKTRDYLILRPEFPPPSHATCHARDRHMLMYNYELAQRGDQRGRHRVGKTIDMSGLRKGISHSNQT